MLFAFLDTSVLLHYQFFADVDWTRELGAADVTLILAPIVVSELDEKKSSGGRRERRRAAQVIDRLFKEEASETPVHLRNGVQLMALHSPPEDGTFARHQLTQSSQDDRQLASIFEFLARGHTVCLLSADYGLTMRAKGRGIDARRPAAELKLPDEPDDTERELENVRRELASLLAAMPKPV